MDPEVYRRLVVPFIVGGLGALLGGFCGFLLAHNTSSARGPFSVLALCLGVVGLAAATVLFLRTRPPT